MSSASEDPGSLDQPSHTRNVKFSYTRDFLLSLSASDACKKLPSGFDKSILSEFDDAFTSNDRPRPSGGLSMQSFGRTEYGSSPPFRGDSSNYSRGTHGKWDSRSRDSDSQSDRDSDSGRRYGSQSRQSWPNHEHDGLLGSGSFPKPSGFVSGTSPSKFQAHDRVQLSRSNAPYQPPRPYKAVPHTRRDGKDSYNDETFGSAECASEDRAEEERKRRASFELMRKEHHRAFQEKQAVDSDKHKKSDFSWMEDSKEDKKHSGGDTESDESLLIPASEIDSCKSLLSSQASASRPLVPPGFKTTILEKQTGSKPAVLSRSPEVGTSDSGSLLMHSKGSPLLDTLSDNESVKRLGELQPEIMSTHAPFVKKTGDVLNSTFEDDKKVGTTNSFQQFKTSGLPETGKALLSDEFIALDLEKQSRQTMEEQPTSILEKLFGSSLTVSSSGPSISEHLDSKVEGALSPSTVQSSKFAHWFHGDENASVGNVSSTRSNNLLSLIGGGESGGILISDTKFIDATVPSRTFHSSEAVNGLKTSVTIPTPDLEQGKIHDGRKQEPIPVLTCEDLEQSLLSEVSEQKSVMEAPGKGWTTLDTKKEQPKAAIDNRASQHLLSLLQKGNELEEIVLPPSKDVRSFEKQRVSDIESRDTALDNLKEGKSQKSPNVNSTLTLEALFGPAFMKELQSSKESYGQPVPKMDNGPSAVNESNLLLLNHLQQTKMDKEHHLGFDGLRSHPDPSNLQSELGFTLGGLDRRVGYQPTEEGGYTGHPNSLFALGGNSVQREVSYSSKPVDAPDKLGALSAIFKDERSMISHQDDQPLARDFFDMFETKVPHQNVHAQPSPQFRPPQMNHERPLFNSDMQPTRNVQLEFPERMIHRDTPPSHRFSPNIFPPHFHHPEMRPAAFDSPAHHHILQRMHMPGNFPPSHLPPEFTVGAARPRHPSNQVFGFRNQPNRFPAGHQQPGFGGLGMSPPVGVGGIGGGLGNNHPEALQRLLDMELRSNPKPTHPFPGPLGSLNL